MRVACVVAIMTTIVGIRTPTAIVLAADRAVTSGEECQTGISKIYRGRGWFAAFCGDLHDTQGAAQFLTCHPGVPFADVTRKFRVHSVSWRGGDLLDSWGSSSVHVPVGGYAAEGSGAHFALGALHATDGLVKSARERALFALRAAAKHDTNTGGPFDVLIVWPSRQRIVTYER
jgi:20S proteasome alpha/beta subunit